MNQRTKVFIMTWVAVFTIGALSVNYVCAETIKAKDNKPTVKADQNAQKSPLKVKISQREAIRIALKAHQGAKFLTSKLQKNIYMIHLQTAKGKRLLEVGANTGRILQDKHEVGR